MEGPLEGAELAVAEVADKIRDGIADLSKEIIKAKVWVFDRILDMNASLLEKADLLTRFASNMEGPDMRENLEWLEKNLEWLEMMLFNSLHIACKALVMFKEHFEIMARERYREDQVSCTITTGLGPCSGGNSR